LRYDPSAGQWEIVNVNLELNDNDINNVGSARIESLSNERVIDPSRSDLFTAIHEAISELAPEGGKVAVPRSNDNNSYSPSIDLDLSAGAHNQDEDTPIIIEGHAAGAGNVAGKAVEVDCSNAQVTVEDGANTRRNIVIRDLLFDGGGSGSGIVVDSSNTVGLKKGSFENIRLKRFGKALDNPDCDIINSRFEDCHWRKNSQHIVKGGEDLNDVTFVGCDFLSATDTAIELGGVKLQGLRFRDCSWEGNKQGVFDISATVKHAVIAGYMEDNNKNGSNGESIFEFSDNVSVLKLRLTEKGHGVNGPFIKHKTSGTLRRLHVQGFDGNTNNGTQFIGSGTGGTLSSIRITDSLVGFDLDTTEFNSAVLLNVFPFGSTTFDNGTTFVKSTGAVQRLAFGPNAARLEYDGANGEIIAVDDAGNTTTIS
jgi:hypothetical protein